MSIVIEILKPLVIGYLTSEGARGTLIEILEKLAAKSDNKIDDALVAAAKRALGV